MLIETSITKGFRAAISLDLGVVLADVFFIIFCYYTSKQLVDNINNQPGLFVLGGSILLVYGAYIFIQRKKEDEKIKLENQKLVSRFDFLTLMCKKDHRMCLLFISRNFVVDLNFVVCAR